MTDLGLIGETRDEPGDGEALVKVEATTKIGNETFSATRRFVQPVTLEAMIQRWGKRGLMEYAIKAWAIDVKSQVRRSIEALQANGTTRPARKKATYIDLLSVED